jgi:hypothetical protein
MAKLYWRYKKNGKWNWKAAEITYFSKQFNYVQVDLLEDEQE